MYSLKFGGTSMGSAQTISEVAGIIISHPEKQKTVTVSAMSGVTDLLLQSAKSAIEEDKKNCTSIIKTIKQKHLEALDGLVRDPELLKKGKEFINTTLHDLEEFLSALSVIQELSSKSYDEVVCAGEILSAFLLSLHLQDKGIKSTFINLEDIVAHDIGKVDKQFFHSVCDELSSLLCPLIDSGDTPVVTGFFGRIPGGIVSAVGRGYSDFTASLVGKACKADEIQIWTDVSGILSTDPRIVSSAHVLEELSFDEASELANFGAKVIHPQTIWPAVKDDITVRIKNTMAPLDAGTAITRKGKNSKKAFKSITAKKGITVINVFSKNAESKGVAFMAKIFSVLSHHNLETDIIATSEEIISFTLQPESTGIMNALEELKTFCNVKRCDDRAIIAIVGGEMRGISGVSGKVFSALGEAGVNIKMISQGATELNITAIVEEKDMKLAIKAIHDKFFGG